MVRSVEPLELPAATYQALEQIARLHGTTPAGAVERLVQQFQSRENLQALRQEYQQLADKELNRTITVEEKSRLEEICDQINAIEMQSEANRAWQSRTEEMNHLLQDLKHTLESFPDRQRDEK